MITKGINCCDLELGIGSISYWISTMVEIIHFSRAPQAVQIHHLLGKNTCYSIIRLLSIPGAESSPMSNSGITLCTIGSPIGDLDWLTIATSTVCKFCHLIAHHWTIYSHILSLANQHRCCSISLSYVDCFGPHYRGLFGRSYLGLVSSVHAKNSMPNFMYNYSITTPVDWIHVY